MENVNEFTKTTRIQESLAAKRRKRETTVLEFIAAIANETVRRVTTRRTAIAEWKEIKIKR